jgi:hypothetical protein
MFETRAVIRPTRYALETPLLQRDYVRVWQDLRRHFTPPAVHSRPRAAAGPSARPRARKRSRR